MTLSLGVLLPGCGGKSIPENVPESAGLPYAKDALVDLSELLKRLGEGNQQPPADAAAFANYDVEHPAIATLISNGMVVYNYGATINGSDAGSKWVAMQSGAKESGGWVLLSNGTVKDLKASEIVSLSPASPK
jgi:hypothetical protein